MISPDMTPDQVRELLRALMTANSLTVAQVAELTMCQTSTIYGYLNGNDPMPPARLDHLIAKLKQRGANGTC